jgi:pyridoxine kinase
MRVVAVDATHADTIEHARLDTTPKGTGDMFSATLAAGLVAGGSLGYSTRAACERVLQVLTTSHAAGSAEMLVFPGERS